MSSKNLHSFKAPISYAVAEQQLERTGLSFQYFPAFEQKSHQFHTHSFVEMLFVINGTFRHIAGDRTYDETAGGLTILNCNQFHTLKTPAGAVELINVYWNTAKYSPPELPAPFDIKLQQLIPRHPQLGHRLNRVVHLQMTPAGKTESILKMLCAEQKNRTAGKDAAINSLFRLLLIEICRASPVADETFEPFNHRMEKIRQHLDKHFAAPVRLEQLCELSGLHEANLCRQFKKHTGLCIGDYLKQRRLAAAMHRLKNTGEKIVTICHDCGFSDISNFNRTFRQLTGKTPSAYRTEK